MFERRREMEMIRRRRRRRRLLIGGMIVVGSTEHMRKLSAADEAAIVATTGKSPEEMEPEELDQAIAASGVQPQPVTAEDQQAMATAEANDPEG